MVNLFPREDVAEGLPEENPEGGLQSTPWGTNFELKVLPEGTDSPHYTQGFSTDCHSNQILTVNKRTKWKLFQPMSALGFSVAKQQENGKFV